MPRLSKPWIPDGPVRLYYERLHAIHGAAGQPSVRQIQRATRGSRWPNGINPTTIHDAFAKPRLATWEVVREIALRLGGNVSELEVLWRRAREAQLYRRDPAELDGPALDGSALDGSAAPVNTAPASRVSGVPGPRSSAYHAVEILEYAAQIRLCCQGCQHSRSVSPATTTYG